MSERLRADLKASLAATADPAGIAPFAIDMTLRDWFAGQALAGVMQSQIVLAKQGKDAGDQSYAAQIAYCIADALLAERSKP